MQLKLGKSVIQTFFLAMVEGCLIFLAVVLVIQMSESPFRYGHAGMSWMFVHLASGLMMVYAGMFGLMTCDVTEVSASNFKMTVAWTAFGVVAGLYVFALAICFSGSLPVTTPPTWADTAVAWTGSIVAIQALFIYIQACRYFMRLHRLLQPYKDLAG